MIGWSRTNSLLNVLKLFTLKTPSDTVFCCVSCLSWSFIQHTVASLVGLVQAACWKAFWKAELSAEIFFMTKDSFLHSLSMLCVGFLDILIAVLLSFLITHSNMWNAYSFVILLTFRVVFKVTTHFILCSL